jgi:hypothetical protein
MKKLLVLLVLKLVLISTLFADEGMWIPILMQQYNFGEMQAKGFKLTAEDIYSVNNASMKDAVVIFGGGCTGAIISDEGLLITNHHCGYGNIQKHSSLEHDYLTNGFWAMTRAEELSNPGLKVTFLISMEDVTDLVLKGVDDNMTVYKRTSIIEKNIEEIESKAVDGTHYEARIESFYNGNQYFLFINEVFTDVRLVGAPPSAIGKFGGDTDNWMWPRHTGDFSIFRVYCDKEGKPADFSKDNVPLKPKRFFPVSINGVKKGDFTMVFGYPGTTTEYLPSFAVEQIQNESDPARILIRGKKLDIINVAMNSDPLIRIQYSAKAASVANGWKKWIGEVRGLKRLNAIDVKRDFENGFTAWVNSDKTMYEKYGNILSQYEKTYKELSAYNMAMIYINEAAFGSDAVLLALRMRGLEGSKDASEESLEWIKKDAQTKADIHFKDYNEKTDKLIFAEMLRLYYENIPKEFHPAYFEELDKISKKSTDKYLAITDYCYSKSIFANQEKFNAFLQTFSSKSYKKVVNDPLYVLMKGFLGVYQTKIMSPYDKFTMTLDSLDRVYMKAQMEYQPNRRFYPDANFTLRITYGQVDDYDPVDGVEYEYYTTLKGIIEKDNPDIYDYDVPDKLKELYYAGDFGKYADSDGTMHVAFIGTNHTTGGNSGSPVINANGELIGLNFDRNWEGTMSDVMYDPDMCRNITLDIRYALFIIDKYAGASHLIEEMEIR